MPIDDSVGALGELVQSGKGAAFGECYQATSLASVNRGATQGPHLHAISPIVTS